MKRLYIDIVKVLAILIFVFMFVYPFIVHCKNGALSLDQPKCKSSQYNK